MLVFLLFIFLLSGCGGGASEEELNMINVEAEAQDLINQDGETKVVVKVTNNNDKYFSGQIKVVSLDIDGSHLGFDGFYPKELEPGKSAMGITWLKVAEIPNLETEVLSGSFE